MKQGTNSFKCFPLMKRLHFLTKLILWLFHPLLFLSSFFSLSPSVSLFLFPLPFAISFTTLNLSIFYHQGVTTLVLKMNNCFALMVGWKMTEQLKNLKSIVIRQFATVYNCKGNFVHDFSSFPDNPIQMINFILIHFTLRDWTPVEFHFIFFSFQHFIPFTLKTFELHCG